MSYRIAGIDVHKKMLAVVVSDVEIEQEYQFERRLFSSSPEQLRSLATWLLEQDVEIWRGLPLWSPDNPEFAEVWHSDVSPAMAAGLVCRPIEDTVRDTWAWLKDEPSPSRPTSL